MGRPKSAAPPDLRTADPTLRLDLLAGVRGVTFEAVERDIFNFGVRKAPRRRRKKKRGRRSNVCKKQLESSKTHGTAPKSSRSPASLRCRA